MTRSGPAAGGGTWVEVPPERVVAWLDGFARRHGRFEAAGTAAGVDATAADGAVARLRVPFPPPGGFEGAADPVATVAAHARSDRRVGVLLVRRGGHAAGVFHGARLVASKVDTTYVQARTKAGGWSQRRFARRRDNQADQATRHAAAVAARVLLPHLAGMEALLLGGDRGMATAVLADPALAPLRPLLAEPFLTVADPRLAVLQAAPDRFRAVRVDLTEPGPAGPGPAEPTTAEPGSAEPGPAEPGPA